MGGLLGCHGLGFMVLYCGIEILIENIEKSVIELIGIKNGVNVTAGCHGGAEGRIK
jgi:hypothetical protein